MTTLLTAQCWCFGAFVEVATSEVVAGRTGSCGRPWCRPGVIVVRFDPPAELMSMNDRDHWAVKAKKVAVWRHAAFIAARCHNVKPQPRTLVGISLPVQRMGARRDGHNYFPCSKAAIDGLVDARVWPDDTGEYVVTTEPTFHQGGPVVLTLEAMP